MPRKKVRARNPFKPITPPTMSVYCWGPGHTRFDDPAVNGWEVQILDAKKDRWLIRRDNDDGCVLVEPADNGKFGLQLYCHTPPDAVLDGTANETPKIRECSFVVGWGSRALAMLEQARKLDELFAV